jgi:hypothetical protein
METALIVYALISIISLIVLYFIIQNASGSANIRKQLFLQNQILLHIAKKQGVDIEKVNELNEWNNKIK